MNEDKIAWLVVGTIQQPIQLTFDYAHSSQLCGNCGWIRSCPTCNMPPQCSLSPYPTGHEMAHRTA